MRRVVPRRRHRRRFATTKANEARVTRCVGVRRQPEGAGLVFFRRRRERRRCRPQRRLRARRCPTPVERGAALACAGVVDEGRGDALRLGGGTEARDDATGRRDVVIALHVERHERRCDKRRRAMGGDAAPRTSRIDVASGRGTRGRAAVRRVPAQRRVEREARRRPRALAAGQQGFVRALLDATRLALGAGAFLAGVWPRRIRRRDGTTTAPPRHVQRVRR